MTIRLIITGPPGSGKGTQAKLLQQKLNVAHISTGDILREQIKAKTELGLQTEAYINQGALVPDQLIVELVKNRLTNPDCQAGYILDGFPRTSIQLKTMLENDVKIDWVININLDSKTIVERVSGRRIHEKSGRIYHISTNPPKQEGIDDITKEALTQRPDDNQEVISERLSEFYKMTEPLMKEYSELAQQNKIRILNCDVSTKTIEQIFQEITDTLKLAPTQF